MATAPSLSVNAPAWTRGGDARLTGSKAPISPSSSSRMTAESCVNVLFDEYPEDRREVMAAAVRAQRAEECGEEPTTPIAEENGHVERLCEIGRASCRERV